MSRGTKVFVASAGLLTLAVAFMSTSPAEARTVSESVAAVDNIAPDAPTAADAFPGAGGVELSWTASPSEGSRPSPVGGDFTSFGTFSNVSDVSGYNVWFSESGAPFEAIPGPGGGPPTVGAGVTEFIDALAVSGPSYVYRITAWDGTNDSDPAETAPVSLGPPPVLEVETGSISGLEAGPVTLVVSNTATDVDATLFVTAETFGDGFAVSPTTLEVAPGSAGNLEVSFDPAGVNNINGTYEALLTLRTNDPDPVDRFVQIFLGAVVAGGVNAANITVNTESISFGQVLIGETSSRDLVITNNGGETLNISAITLAGDGEFTATPAGTLPLAVGGDSQTTVAITFSPVAAVTSSATLTIESDALLQPSVEVAISGSGVTEITGPGTASATVNNVQVTFNVDLDLADQAAVDQFKTDFRTRIAAELGISESRILNISLSTGSTVVDFQIIDDPAGVEQSATDAATALEAAITADATVFSDLGLGDASGGVGTEAVVTIQPQDPNGAPILGWFKRGEGQAGPVYRVGLDDFFVFGDAFGSSVGDAAFNTKFDIAGPGNTPPDGEVGFDDFFKFRDDFGKVVDNAADIKALLGIN